MKEDPDRFRKFDAKNGWGVYDDFMPWVEDLLNACVVFPQASVHSCR